MGVHIDGISHYGILITVRQSFSGIGPCSRARNVASGMALFRSLRFIALGSEFCEQAPEFFDLANTLLLIFDLQQ